MSSSGRLGVLDRKKLTKPVNKGRAAPTIVKEKERKSASESHVVPELKEADSIDTETAPVEFPPNNEPEAEPDTFDPSGKYKMCMNGSHAIIEASVSRHLGGVRSWREGMMKVCGTIEIEVEVSRWSPSEWTKHDWSYWAEKDIMHVYKPEDVAGPDVGGSVMLAPSLPGDIILVELDGVRDWLVRKQNFLACDSDMAAEKDYVMTNIVEATGYHASAIGCVQVSGYGRLLVNMNGAAMRFDLEAGEKHIIDTGHLAAWTDDIQLNFKPPLYQQVHAHVEETHMEPLCHITGPGTFYLQTRSAVSFAMDVASYIHSVLRRRSAYHDDVREYMKNVGGGQSPFHQYGHN